MKKFLAVATSMATTLSLLTACGSNTASTETTAAAANEVASEKGIAGKEAEESEPVAETAGANSIRFQSSVPFCGLVSLHLILSSLASFFTEKCMTQDAVDSSFPDPSISVYVAPGGSGMGVSAATDGTADFGMLAGDIRDSEIEALREHYQELVVAKDALTMSVSAENPICGIMDDTPAETIRRIFAGEIATWDQVDSTLPVETINIYIRDLPGGTYEVFQKNIVDDNEMATSATQSASMTELTTNIAGDKWGISYAGFGACSKANADERILTATKADGVKATAENIISGAYTIQRPVIFVADAEITPSEQAFIDHTFSQTGYGVVEASGCMSVFTPEA